jgi:hypothetical protein
MARVVKVAAAKKVKVAAKVAKKFGHPRIGAGHKPSHVGYHAPKHVK